jgi:hypothetical protein
VAKVLVPRIQDAQPARRGGVAWSARVAGARKASDGDDYGERLQKYIPLKVSGAFPILDHALESYPQHTIAGISPHLMDILVEVALGVFILVEINQAYARGKLKGWARWRLQIIQSLFNLTAFVLWTYTLKGQIWGGTNNLPVVIILNVLFLLFAAYAPEISPKEAAEAGEAPTESAAAPAKP